MVNKLYQHDETTLWFVPATATQAEDAAFEVPSTLQSAGERSAFHDFGTAARAKKFAYRGFVQLAGATPAVRESIRMYAITANLITTANAHPDNDDGSLTSSIAVSNIDKLTNLRYIDSIVVDEAAQNIEFVKSGEVWLPQRFFAIVFWNACVAADITSDVNESGFMLTPIPDESQ